MRMSESSIGSLLYFGFSSYGQSVIVEMNIKRICALRKFLWCDAARRKSHNSNKRRLSFRRGCQQTGQGCSKSRKNSVKSQACEQSERMATAQKWGRTRVHSRLESVDGHLRSIALHA